ncbi:erythrocyte membrane associated protein 1 [Plasmodium yoelii yoelii]|uniref:Erythrocyte membrane associated protein 1 n=1 Tax=Plasmodium yoelii yoelii TaxID=73239 RepID=A0AAE9WR61_PLAYO|nr:erythrocyte membrane associated protein 1 [Plasmodium yoelii yoelii]
MTKINIKIFFFALNLLIHLNNKSFAKDHTSSTDGVYEDEEALVNTTLEDSNPFNDDTPDGNTFPDDTPADDTFPDDTPADDTLPDDTPADDTPADDTPADDTLPDDTPADDTLPDDTPADDTPADDTLPDDTPADDTLPDDTPKPTSNKKRKKKKSLTSYINPEELQKSKDIMDEAVFHLKRYSDYNNGHNCYYLVSNELYLCFMEENGIKFEKFHLVIPNPYKV